MRSGISGWTEAGADVEKSDASWSKETFVWPFNHRERARPRLV